MSFLFNKIRGRIGMIRILEIETTALPVDKIIAVVKTPAFYKFVLSLYGPDSKHTSFPMVAYDICQAINENTTGAAIAIPVFNKVMIDSAEYNPEKSVIFQISGKYYDLTDRLYAAEGSSTGYSNSTYMNYNSFGKEMWQIRDYIIDKTKSV
jgi:hypothetical protein